MPSLLTPNGLREDMGRRVGGGGGGEGGLDTYTAALCYRCLERAGLVQIVRWWRLTLASGLLLFGADCEVVEVDTG